MRDKSLISLCLVLTLVASLFTVSCAKPSPAPTETIEWKCPCTFPATNLLVSTVWQGIADDVYERTEGKLKITIYPGGELGYPPGEMLRFVRDGEVPIAEIGWPYVAGDFPLGKFCELPFIAEDFDDWANVLHPIWYDLVKEPLEQDWDSVALLHVPFSYVHLWTTDAPLTSVDAFNGRKFRIWEPEMGEIFEAMGVTTTTMTWGDVYMALQRGVIDGGPTGYTTAKDAKLNEVCKYCTECTMLIPDNSLVVNKDALDALPSDVREVLLEVGQEWQLKALDAQQKNNDECRTWCIENGVEVFEMPAPVRNKMIELAMPTWESWAKRAGPLGDEALQKLAKARAK